jgi:hypothetical protein
MAQSTTKRSIMQAKFNLESSRKILATWQNNKYLLDIGFSTLEDDLSLGFVILNN